MAAAVTGEAVAAFRQYSAVFEKLDPSAVVPFFSQPAILISPQGMVGLATGQDVERFFAPLMLDLRGQGYAKSEFPRLTEHWLSPDVAIVSGVGVWRKATGEELRRFGLTYTFSRKPGTWQIMLAVVHAPETALDG
jgi:hypothetical protein